VITNLRHTTKLGFTAPRELFDVVRTELLRYDDTKPEK
jgi:hypothetical protein